MCVVAMVSRVGPAPLTANGALLRRPRAALAQVFDGTLLGNAGLPALLGLMWRGRDSRSTCARKSRHAAQENAGARPLRDARNGSPGGCGSMRQLLIRCTAVGLGVVVALALAEVGLRLLGLAPPDGVATVTEAQFQSIPGILLPDQDLVDRRDRRLPHHVT